MYALVFMTLGLGAAANMIPAVELKPRAAYAGGGWGLITTSTDQSGCPSGSTWHSAAGWSPQNVCCPNGFNPQATDHYNSQFACCPQGSTCLDALEAEPFCADNSWVLWNATMQNWTDVGYFCCLQGQIGTQNFLCDSGASNVVASLSAVMLGQPVPTGAAGVTVAVSAGTASITSNSVTGAATMATTTTKGGAGGVVSSILAGVTGKSDASMVSPLQDNLADTVFSGGSLIAVFLGLNML